MPRFISEKKQEVNRIIKCLRLGHYLAIYDIKMRYSRSILGPFWVTITLAVTIFGLAFTFGNLFKQDLSGYLIYLTVGFFCWYYISHSIIEATTIMIETKNWLLNSPEPPIIAINRVFLRNVYLSIHQVPVILIVLYIYPVGSIPNALHSAAAVFILLGTVYPIIILSSIVGARFTDTGIMITQIIQFVFFVTPIIWTKELMIERGLSAIFEYNPFFQLIELFRSVFITSLDHSHLENCIINMVAINILSFIFYMKFKNSLKAII